MRQDVMRWVEELEQSDLVEVIKELCEDETFPQKDFVEAQLQRIFERSREL